MDADERDERDSPTEGSAATGTSDADAEAPPDVEAPPESSGAPDAPQAAEPAEAPAKPAAPPPARGSSLLLEGARSRRLIVALGVYLLCSVVFAAVAGRERLSEHTPFNHYALLADAWLHGRQDLPNGPPAYSMGNDFATFEGKTYISFPPFPALVMLPMVAAAGSPENFRDGQFMVWLAGLGPALLFLVLEKLRRTGRSERSETTNAVLALLFAFGSVYFFTAVEGTVWFAAHVIGVALLAGFLLVALDAEQPLVAGLLVACAWTTRPGLLFASIFFGLEAIRRCCDDELPTDGTFVERVAATWRRADKARLTRMVAIFSAPILVSFAVASWMNDTRFHNPSPFAFGHEYLSIAWRGRIERWGLFGYHYLAKNLGVMLTIMPWLPPHGAHASGQPAFVVNEHGLALWFTTPLYFWLFRPRKAGYLYASLAVTAGIICFLDLLYQNSGWRQFGYRFSNDYAVLLFVMVAIGGRRVGWAFRAAAAWAVGWNLFGALTFDRGGPLARYYYGEGTQTVLYQPD